MSSNAVTAAVSSASFGLFLGALPLSTAPQGCFLSPLSIVYALSLALNGAGPQSPTQVELLRVISGAAVGSQNALSEAELNSELGRVMTLLNGQCAEPGTDGGTSKMILANSVWTKRDIQLKEAYVDAMQSLYQATARVATHGAKDINDWVSNITQGMITDLLQSDNFDAVLANAIYFKGLWTHAFKPEVTKPGNFTTAAGSAKQVNFMSQQFEPRDRILGVRKAGLYSGVSMPYKGDTFSAIALLPAEGVQPAAVIKDWASGPKDLTPMGSLRVVLPKFKVTSTHSLTNVLMDLGVRAAFDHSANFSRMSETPLHISDVVHKAVVEVDEEGTVAAAATAVVMLRCAMPMRPPEEIVFNRPFVFIINHIPTGLPSFIGIVNDPSAA